MKKLIVAFHYFSKAPDANIHLESFNNSPLSLPVKKLILDCLLKALTQGIFNGLKQTIGYNPQISDSIVSEGSFRAFAWKE